MIPVGRLAPVDQWDQTMLDALFSTDQFKRFEGYPKGNGCALIIPGRYWAGHEAEISAALARYQWVLAFRTGDEENVFDINQVTHPNILWWVQTPKVGVDYRARLFGVGHTPHFKNLPAETPAKNLAVFLSAQRTHSRREAAFSTLDRVDATKRVEATTGFTQGMDPAEYADCMMAAKIAPCPSGAVSPDSFRVFEALEAHAIPIADDVSPVYDSQGFWRLLFPDAPFPILTSYTDLPGWTEDLLAGWPANANRITAWWMRQKRGMAINLVEDLRVLGAL
jgi:hypothetical protein